MNNTTNRIIKASLLLGGIFYPLLSIGLPSWGAENISALAFAEHKITMERSLELKAQNMLDLLLGQGKSQINVNITISPVQKEEVTYKPNTAAQDSRAYLWQDPKKTNPSILPGFLKESGEEKNYSPPVAPLNISRSFSPMSSLIQRIEATLLIDKGIPQQKSEEAQKSVAYVLGINPSRNDTLVVLQTTLVPGWKQLLLTADFQYKIIFLLLICLIILMSLYGFARVLDAFARALASMSGGSRGMRVGLMPGSASEEGREDAAILSNTTPPNKHAPSEDPSPTDIPDSEFSKKETENLNQKQFGFINEKNTRMAIEFLRKESAQNICLVLSSISPEIAQEILNHLPPTLKTETILQFAKPLTNMAQIREDVSGRMKSFVDGSVDTSEPLKRIYASLGAEAQKQILNDLKKSTPKFAAWLEKSVLRFENLFDLELESRTVIFTSLPAQIVAQGLSGLGIEELEKLLNGLPPGIRKRIDQYIQLAGPTLLEHQEKARIKLMAGIYDLVKEGKIKPPFSESSKDKENPPWS